MRPISARNQSWTNRRKQRGSRYQNEGRYEGYSTYRVYSLQQSWSRRGCYTDSFYHGNVSYCSCQGEVSGYSECTRYARGGYGIQIQKGYAVQTQKRCRGQTQKRGEVQRQKEYGIQTKREGGDNNKKMKEEKRSRKTGHGIEAKEEGSSKTRKKKRAKIKKRDIYIKEEEQGRIEEEEVTRRNHGLSCPISSENKGFAMLQSMGYTVGMGLGKSEQGRKVPVGIKFKTDRSGIGEEADRAKRVHDIIKRGIDELIGEKVDVKNYRSRIKESIVSKSATEDLETSQRACRYLDTKKGVKEPQESWYWPKELRHEGGEEKEAVPGSSLTSQGKSKSYTNGMKLAYLTKYLREVHSYCVWCATEYDGQEDLLENCPGPTKARHKPQT